MSKIKDEVYITNLEEYESIGSNWIALYGNAENVTSGIEHISEETRKCMGNKNIIRNIYRIEPFNSIMCGYFCIGFIDFMYKGKSLLEYTILFSPNEYKRMTKYY